MIFEKMVKYFCSWRHYTLKSKHLLQVKDTVMTEEEDSTADVIAEIFSKHLPCIPSEVAEDFARGMRLYHAAFKTYRDTAMNYEMLPEYQASSYIMKVPGDQFWPFTPYFRKIAALVIQYLFKTEINALSSSEATMDQTLLYVDKGANRWIMTIGESSCDCSTTMYSIYMYFPRSNTPKATSCSTQTTPIEQLIDSSYLKDHGIEILTQDISNWTAK